MVEQLTGRLEGWKGQIFTSPKNLTVSKAIHLPTANSILDSCGTWTWLGPQWNAIRIH